MNKAYLSLGSNEGDRSGLLSEAVARIEEECGELVAVSHLYETAAWGLESQPDFLNMALCISTQLAPIDLLAAIRQIETHMGRQRTVKWGQRTLDIDILFYESMIISEPNLSVPHPHLHERRFVLMPLAEIAADFVHPDLKKSVKELLKACPDTLEVSIYHAPKQK